MTEPNPNPPAPAPAPPTPAPTPAPPATDPPPPADPPQDTDWKAEARKWEKLAKDNKNAATELEKLRTANMSEQEKAVADAEAKGRTAAATEYGTELATAKFEAAAALAGVNLGEAADLIDTRKFLDDKGKVDEAAIKKAVAKLAKLAPAGPARSGADLNGGPGQQPTTLDQQIAEAEKARDFTRAIALKRQRAAAQSAT